MAEKPRFQRQTVFAKNLGFGVGFGYRNNTTFDLGQWSYMAGHAVNPSTKFEDPMAIRS